MTRHAMSEAQTDGAVAAPLRDFVQLRRANAGAKPDANEEVERLSLLDDIDRARELAGAAERLELPRGELRRLVEIARKRRKAVEAAEAALRNER